VPIAQFSSDLPLKWQLASASFILPFFLSMFIHSLKNKIGYM